jgi:CRISPR/Cas system CSM-associated protein Csm3 (group 7 of RAMP superfamily)
MSKTIEYQIEFFSEWHCGSGLAAGADVDALVVKDKDKLPFVPGKTIKGLIREAADVLTLFGEQQAAKMKTLFGNEADAESGADNHGCLFFSNAELSKAEHDAIVESRTQDYLYRTKASTKIDDNGIAQDASLRRIETVVPCTLTGSITDVPDEDVANLETAMKYIKRMGINRNRGLGRCQFTATNIKEAK